MVSKQSTLDKSLRFIQNGEVPPALHLPVSSSFFLFLRTRSPLRKKTFYKLKIEYRIIQIGLSVFRRFFSLFQEAVGLEKAEHLGIHQLFAHQLPELDRLGLSFPAKPLQPGG